MSYADCEVRRPSGLQEALEILDAEPGQWTPFAGGTDLMVALRAGRLAQRRFLDISALKELKGVDDGDQIRVGALCTFTELRECPFIHHALPNLLKSARLTGAVAIQNRATVGGNIMNASPAADTPPSLLAYGAELELVSIQGRRRVPYESFHQGYKRMGAAPNELLLAIHIPKPIGKSFHFFRKVGTRRAQAISKLSLAAHARLEGGRIEEIRIALGAVAAVPMRASRAESVLKGAPLNDLPIRAALGALQEDISPIDDIRSSAHYRRVVSGNVLEQMLLELGSLAL